MVTFGNQPNLAHVHTIACGLSLPKMWRAFGFMPKAVHFHAVPAAEVYLVSAMLPCREKKASSLGCIGDGAEFRILVRQYDAHSTQRHG